MSSCLKHGQAERALGDGAEREAAGAGPGPTGDGGASEDFVYDIFVIGDPSEETLFKEAPEKWRK